MARSLKQHALQLYPTKFNVVMKAYKSLLSQVEKLPHLPVARIERALLVALSVHRSSQERTAGIPYVVHPIEVAIRIIELLGPAVTLEQIQAALLHDAVEDEPEAVFYFGTRTICPDVPIGEKRRLAYRELEILFGRAVTATVTVVTNPDFTRMAKGCIQEGDSRSEGEIKNELYTTHVVKVLKSETDAAVVKLADLWENALSLHKIAGTKRAAHLKARYSALVLSLPELLRSLPDSHPLAECRERVLEEVESQLAFFRSAD